MPTDNFHLHSIFFVSSSTVLFVIWYAVVISVNDFFSLFKAFGAPTIVATDAEGQQHMLFGSDRFHILADILGETYHGPLLEFNKCSKL